nr:MAG TPA: hypothetical protein [Caudoviricetes sp.]
MRCMHSGWPPVMTKLTGTMNALPWKLWSSWPSSTQAARCCGTTAGAQTPRQPVSMPLALSRW